MLIPDYNPDVLTCLANLSSDEVFTPPKLANEILDLFPSELWSDETARFLDPGCKSGVFLREIAKRLDQGLEQKIPDRQERINHICKNQLFALAITELTALLARRSVYCSKKADGEYSVCDAFDEPEGNIRFIDSEHTWENGKCIFCGVSEKSYSDLEHGERHAYSFIHIKNPKDLFNMKFDVIIGNPPYQMSDGGAQASASPIYQKFVAQAKKMGPRFLSMIIPSRWFAGGKGLDRFREEMLSDRRLRNLVDYPVASDAFPGVKVIGGVCYFLWDRDNEGDCQVTSVMKGVASTSVRALDEFDVFIRFNQATSVVRKVQAKNLPSFSDLVSAQKPFGLRTYVKPSKKGDIALYGNKSVGQFSRSDIPQGADWIDSWKVFVSMGYGEGGESREYPRRIIGKPIVASPPSACTETYLSIGPFAAESEALNCAKYLQTQFVRFLIGLRKNTQHVNRHRFEFVPLLPLDKEWNDEDLYAYFGLDTTEIDCIEQIVKKVGE